MTQGPIRVLEEIERANDERREAQRLFALTAAVLGPPRRRTLWQRLLRWLAR